MGRRRIAVLVTMLIVLLAAPGAVRAQDEEPSLEFFYPLVTRRPVIERELELRVDHLDAGGGRTTSVLGAVEIPLLPRWQVELEVPLVVNQPRDERTAGGVGDVTLENKFLLYKSIEQRVLVAGGFETRFPTGSERRGLGGEASVEPFVTGAIAIGDFDILGELAYEFNVNAHVKGPQEQEFTASAALGYRMTRRLTPLIELTTVTQTRGNSEEAEHEIHLHDRPQVYATPGFDVRPFPGSTLALGVQLPLTTARKFDYAVRALFIWEF